MKVKSYPVKFKLSITVPYMDMVLHIIIYRIAIGHTPSHEMRYRGTSKRCQGALKNRPSLPKYQETWDEDSVVETNLNEYRGKPHAL